MDRRVAIVLVVMGSALIVAPLVFNYYLVDYVMSQSGNFGHNMSELRDHGLSGEMYCMACPWIGVAMVGIGVIGSWVDHRGRCQAGNL